jgi:GT2 family glycosyltransferase
MYYEETDLSWRARLAGYECLYVPSSVVCHDYQPELSLNAFYYSERNRPVLIIKHWKLFTLMLMIPSILLSEAVELGYACLYGRKSLAAKLRAYGWWAQNWPSVLKKRQGVQLQRKRPDRALLEACTPYLSPREVRRHPWPNDRRPGEFLLLVELPAYFDFAALVSGVTMRQSR